MFYNCFYYHFNPHDYTAKMGRIGGAKTDELLLRKIDETKLLITIYS